ncbi:MAG: hypothetical protein EOP56_07670 [Sphingobacteriales bacterium]|nr:MAG: hypothetical protein EOP56_07670 [Sphingobacteriales bacterium]
MFLVVFALLLVEMRFSNRPDYNDLKRSLNHTFQHLENSNNELYTLISEDTLYIRFQQAKIKASTVCNAHNECIKFLSNAHDDLIKNHYAGFYSKSSGDNTWMTNQDEKLVDSIQTTMDSLFHLLKSVCNPRYHDALVIFLPIAKYCTGVFDQTAAPLQRLLFKTSVKERSLILSAMRNDIAQSTEVVYNQLLNEYYNTGCSWGIPATVIGIPAPMYSFEGQSIQAKITLGWRHYSYNPIIEINDGEIVKQEGGISYWNKKAASLGAKTISGNAVIYDEKKKKHEFPWSFQYLVLAKGVSLQLNRAKTAYAGVPNPISVSMPGYEASKLTLRIPNAKVNKINDGQYEFTPEANTRELLAYVDAENSEGVTSTVAGLKMKIVALPAPILSIPTANENRFSLNDFKTLKSIDVTPANEDFPIEYRLESYTLILIKGQEFFGPVSVQNNVMTGNEEIERLKIWLQPVTN